MCDSGHRFESCETDRVISTRVLIRLDLPLYTMKFNDFYIVLIEIENQEEMKFNDVVLIDIENQEESTCFFC